MFCPDCGSEYRPEISTCAECGTALVVTLPPAQAPDPHSKTVEVYKTSDPMMLPIVKSILDGAEIDYFVQGEEALGLYPIGAMASAVSKASLAARVHVFERDAETVGALLAEIEEGAIRDGEIDEAEDVVESADD